MRCNYCEWRCELTNGKIGICKMYAEDKNGKIIERFPDKWCTCGISKIESIPFYHAYPGSRSLTIGTSGCNFNCRYCSNAFIAKEDPEILQDRMLNYSPQEIVDIALKMGCHNIVFNVNEPTVSIPSVIEVAKHARRRGIPVGCLTNGYTTEETTELLASVFSFFNIGLKGFSDRFYREYIGVSSVKPVLRTIRILAQRAHVEIVTPVIQSANDDELDAISDFIAGIDQEIPWHVFRLLPEHDMKEAKYPNIDLINNILERARSELAHVYFHNFVGSDWVNTLCPDCKSVVIERFSLGCGGDRLRRFLCDDKYCPQCGREIRLLGKKMEWNRPEVVI
ncbi:MAG TPA: radical SAM protein [Syntrophorhabdaceae bacterium]|nr:radical SAM protein [Syntrophorhabdaceae bacterium]